MTPPSPAVLTPPGERTGRRPGPGLTGQVPHEADAVLARAVMADRGWDVTRPGPPRLDLEPHPPVKGDRAGVHGRGHRPDDGAAPRADRREEGLIQPPAQAVTPLAGMDAHEVDVRLAGPRLGQETDEEPDQRAGPVRREARVREVLEEEPGQHGGHRPA